MKRREDATGSADPRQPFPDPGWVKLYPTLCEYLSHMEYDDGAKREVSTLGVKEQDGRVLLTLNDKDTSATGYISGETFVDAMRSLEKALQGGSLDWRKWKGGPAKGRRG